MAGHKRTTAEQWGMIRTLYERGDVTYEALFRQFGISVRQIKRVSKANGWEKGSLQARIDEKIRERTVDILADLGLTKRDLLAMIVEGARETRVERVVDGAAGTTVTSGVDNQTTQRYRLELVRILGMHASPKMPVKGDDGGHEEVKDPLENIPVERLEAIERALDGRSR